MAEPDGDRNGWPHRPPVDEDVARALLRDGDARVLGRMPWSSNATFLVELRDGRVFGIDHGIAFHAQWKLRTVIWEFAGESIPPTACSALQQFLASLRSDVGDRLLLSLDRLELDAVRARTEHLLATGVLPEPD